MRRTAEQALAPYSGRYQRLRRLWERRLHHISDGLAFVDWSTFRPLRLREVPWSDWLAWLLETSTTGILAEEMLGQHMDCAAAALRTPKTSREESTETRDRRADIVVTWKGGRKTHIEVKIRDQEFDKTFDTCRSLHGNASRRVWCDAILLSDSSRAAWEVVAEAHAHDGRIDVILWNDVARGLRRSLWSGREPVAWEVWGWALCSAIERQLLGLQEPAPLRSRIGELDMLSRLVEVLELGTGKRL
jgi:hypothetical protein